MIRLVVVLALVGACADDGGPRLEAVTPASAARGVAVTITGTRFCGVAGDCASAGGQVQVGLDQPVRAELVGYDATAAKIIVPQAAPSGATDLVLTVDGRSSNALAFQVLP